MGRLTRSFETWSGAEFFGPVVEFLIRCGFIRDDDSNLPPEMVETIIKEAEQRAAGTRQDYIDPETGPCNNNS